ITERKRTEEALLNATDEIRDLYNAAPCGYHSLDRDGVFVRINDTELEWLGYKRSEVIGKKKMADVLTPPGKKAFARSLREFQKRGWTRAVEIEMLRKNGTTFPALLSASAVSDVDGKFLMTRSTVFDITERRRAEEELRESESRARAIVNTAQDALVAIVESSDDAIIGTNLSGEITSWNRAATRLFRYSTREAVGKPITMLTPPDVPQELSAASPGEKSSRGVEHFETVRMRKNGSRLEVSLTVSPILDADGVIIGAS